MREYQPEHLINKERSFVFLIFCIWTFVLLSRPQDFLTFLAPIRPALILGLVTFLAFIQWKPGLDRQRSLSNIQVRYYVILICLMIISVPFALYRRGAFEFLFMGYVNVILFFLLFFKIVDSPEKLMKVLFIACLGAGLYSIFALTGGGIISKRLSVGNVLDPNDLAFFLLSLLPYNLIFISNDNKLLKRVICISSFVTGILLILMTGSRGGFVGFSAIVFMLLLTKTSAFRLSYKVVFVILILIIVSAKATTIDWERYQGITNYENDYNMTDEEGRMNVWKIGIRIMLSRPLTGVGVACFSAAIGMDREERGLSRTYWQAPHSMLVQIGTETGVIGLALFSLLSFRAFRIFGQVKKRSRSEELIKISEMARVGFAGHFISGMFLSQAYSIYWAFYIVLSAVLYLFLEKEVVREHMLSKTVAGK